MEYLELLQQFCSFLCFAGCKERIHENEEEKTEKIRVIDGCKSSAEKLNTGIC